MSKAKLWFLAITAALGGFLFGFDTCVISGAEEQIKAVFGLSAAMHGWVTSSALWGTVLGAFVGGCICPGVKISMDALTERTALLPGLQLDQPKRAIGRNTIDCMRSGIMMGNACMLDGMVERMEEELGRKCTVIATGGIARFVIPMCRTPMIYDKDLIVKGLAALYRDNKR